MKDKLKIGSLTSRASCSTQADRGDESGDMLAKLKVVSVLESLPGVGKVRARDIMSELDISESRRLRGLGDEPAAARCSRRSTTASPASAVGGVATR